MIITFLKTKKQYIMVIFILLFCLISFCGCDNKKSATKITYKKENPTIIKEPFAKNIMIGQSTDEAILDGDFSVEGILQYCEQSITPEEIGEAKRKWEFIPNDLEKYNKINGEVTIGIYQYMIDFEENGGFEIDDIYFNEEYSLEEKIITAKNDYRFDGWSLAIGSEDYIDYPKTFYSTTTLYAGYRFHSSEKLFYEYSEIRNSVRVKAKWDNEYNTCPMVDANRYTPFDESISGEIIIPDLHEGSKVTVMVDFSYTNITNVVFGNYINEINSGCFTSCDKITEIVIPKTVKTFYGDAFLYCANLEKVHFEESDEALLGNGISAFAYCLSLKEINLDRFETIDKCMFLYSGIEELIIPSSVKLIKYGAFGFCRELKNLTIEGNNLEYIEGITFSMCDSLKEISIPKDTKINPTAFRCSSLEKINITDEQIKEIVDDLVKRYTSDKGNLNVNITRDEKYSGTNYEGEYIANSETINLFFQDFSLDVFDTLFHEFFHYYQYVICYGVGEANFNSIPILGNIEYWDDDYSAITVLQKDGVPNYIQNHEMSTYDELYEYLTDEHNIYTDLMFITTDLIASWKETYIQPDDDYSAYWNQPFEKSAREFATFYTGKTWPRLFY